MHLIRNSWFDILVAIFYFWMNIGIYGSFILVHRIEYFHFNFLVERKKPIIIILLLHGIFLFPSVDWRCSFPFAALKMIILLSIFLFKIDHIMNYILTTKNIKMNWAKDLSSPFHVHIYTTYSAVESCTYQWSVHNFMISSF